MTGIALLSPSEQTIAMLIGQGYRPCTIAHCTDRREKTVHRHLGNIYRKLGLRNEIELGMLVLRTTPPVVRSTAPYHQLLGEALSPRQLEVSYFIHLGYTNKEISIALNISIKTVGAHLKHIYDTLEIGTRLELAILVEFDEQRKYFDFYARQMTEQLMASYGL